MNRIEFMEALSGLLQDIPEEDRMDALKYYNDYFDDAGAENEKNVIDELEVLKKWLQRSRQTERIRKMKKLECRWSRKINHGRING